MAVTILHYYSFGENDTVNNEIRLNPWFAQIVYLYLTNKIHYYAI
jgi:hypothetical protein